MKSGMKVSVALAAVLALSACGVFKGGGGKKTPVLGNRVPILLSEQDVSPDAAVSGVDVLLPPAAANDAWSQSGGNASKSMGHLALGESINRAWNVSIPGSNPKERLAASPVVADNKLFVIDVDGMVHAYAADTGAQLWTAATAETNKHTKGLRFGGGVSYIDGKLFAANGLGDVVAMTASNGAVLWRVKPGGPLRGAPTLANGNVYILSQDNQLYTLAQADGATQWSQSASLESQGVFGVAAPAVGQGTVVAGFSSGELNAYRYENGRSLWQDALSRTTITTSVSSLADIDADPVIDGGRAYAVGQGGRMVALEILTGQRLWEQNLAGTSTPWLAGEWLFVVTDDAKIVCLARATGKIRWIGQLPHWKNEKKHKGAVSWVGPVLAGGRLIAVSSEGDFAYVNPADGTVTGTTHTKAKGGYSLAPIVANNTLYLLSDDGKLSAWR